MEREDQDLDWTEKPFSESFTDLVALGQLAQGQVTKIQKNAALKGMHERCVACLEALCNGLLSHLPTSFYPDELKTCMVRKLGILEKFSLLSKLRAKTIPSDFSKSIDFLINGRNEKIAHPKVKKYPYQILSEDENLVVFDCKKGKTEELDPAEIIKNLIQIIDRFLLEIHQIPEDQLKQFILDSAILPGGGVGVFVNMDLFEVYSILNKEFKLKPRFLRFLESLPSKMQTVPNII